MNGRCLMSGKFPAGNFRSIPVRIESFDDKTTILEISTDEHKGDFLKILKEFAHTRSFQEGVLSIEMQTKKASFHSFGIIDAVGFGYRTEEIWHCANVIPINVTKDGTRVVVKWLVEEVVLEQIGDPNE